MTFLFFFPLQHPYLVSESTANYLVVRAVDYEVESKHKEMRTVARQTILMQVRFMMACVVLGLKNANFVVCGNGKGGFYMAVHLPRGGFRVESCC